MIALTIIIIILCLISFCPVGASASYESGVFYLAAKAGPIKITLFPKKAGARKEPDREETEIEKAEAEPKKDKAKLSFSEIMDLIKMGVRALGRFKKRLSVDEFILHYTCVSDDPYAAAMRYGAVSAALGALLPLIEQAVNFRKKDITVDVDFNGRGHSVICAAATLTLQVWEIMYIALAFGTEFLIWKRTMRHKKASERKVNDGEQPDKQHDGYSNVKD